jgi:hypothetical protein
MIFVSHVVSSDAMNGSSFITLQEPYFLYSILTATCFTGQMEYKFAQNPYQNLVVN